MADTATSRTTSVVTNDLREFHMNVLGLAFALIFLMLPSSHFGLRASPTNMTSESDEKVALCEPATLSQEVQNFFAEVRQANWDGWFRLWIRPAIVALHLRSVSWPSMNFHGLLCHPWPCMSLKLRFVAGSIPSALSIFFSDLPTA